MNWTEEELAAYYEKLKTGGDDAPLTHLGTSDLSSAVPTAPTKAPASPAPRMNKTEYAYSLYLEAERQAGKIHWWAFEAIKLRLADKTYYTPDFAVIRSYMPWHLKPIVFFEVKGFWRDDARVKIKVAAEMYRDAFFFVAVTKSRSADWKYENIGVRKESSEK
jgi:hypothetical protein